MIINNDSTARCQQWTDAMKINFTYTFIAKPSSVALPHCTGLVSIPTIRSYNVSPLWQRAPIYYALQTDTHLYQCTSSDTDTNTHKYTHTPTHAYPPTDTNTPYSLWQLLRRWCMCVCMPAAPISVKLSSIHHQLIIIASRALSADRGLPWLGLTGNSIRLVYIKRHVTIGWAACKATVAHYL